MKDEVEGARRSCSVRCFLCAALGLLATFLPASDNVAPKNPGSGQLQTWYARASHQRRLQLEVRPSRTLVTLDASVEDNEPFPALIDPDARDVVCARCLLPSRAALQRCLVCCKSHVSARQNCPHIEDRIVAQIGVHHVRDFGVQILNSSRVVAAIIRREILLKRISLLVLIGLPSRFFRVSYYRLCRS
jgi:hypothetical protein